jgi:hypothetical protein
MPIISASHMKGMRYTGLPHANRRPSKSECPVRCRNKSARQSCEFFEHFRCSIPDLKKQRICNSRRAKFYCNLLSAKIFIHNLSEFLRT